MALNLVGSSNGTSDLAVQFRTDEAAWRNLAATVNLQAGTGRRAEIWVTIIGQLRGPYRPVAGTRVFGGFGHLGAYPGELVVESIRDVEIRSVPTYDYSSMLPPTFRKKVDR
jgi:hypothetical protein